MLNVSFDEIAANGLSVSLVEAWKPKLEEIARGHLPHAEELALRLLQSTEQARNEQLTAHGHWVAANMYYWLGKYWAADEQYGYAQQLFDRIGDPLSKARMSVGWIHVLGELGQYTQAIRLFQQAQPTLAASDDQPDKVREAGLYGNIGIIYESMGWLQDALDCYKRKYTFFQARVHEGRQAVIEAAVVLNSIGIVYIFMGQYWTAEESFSQALELLEPYGNDRTVWADVALILLNQAWLQAVRSKPLMQVKRAFAAARQQRNLLDQATAVEYFALVDLYEANWLIHQKRWQEVDRESLAQLAQRTAEAGSAYETAYAHLLLGQLALQSGEINDAEAQFETIQSQLTAENPVIAYLASLWRARTYRGQGKVDAARQALEQGIHTIEQTRTRLTEDDYRAGYLDDKLVTYHELADLLIELEDYHAALLTCERAKARTLTDMLQGQSKAQVINSQEIDELSVAGETMAHLLPADTLAISFAVVHETVWAFLLSRKGKIRAPIQLGAKLDPKRLAISISRIQQMGRLSPSLSEDSKAVIDAEVKAAQSILGQWYQDYMAPLQDWLDPNTYSRLLISPDGLLNNLPFSALYDSDGQKYLIETFNVTITPSLAAWASWVQDGVGGENKPFGEQESKVLAIGNTSKDGVQGHLPLTTKEAEMIANLFPRSTLFIHEAATVKNFMEAAPQADIIYLAAHGEYRVGASTSSYIEFADGRLHAGDILALDLKASAVILSACETNRGLLRGNEMMGLVRAFLYAGARAVLATHWSVEDQAMYDLMQDFATQLRSGIGLSRSLSQAQRGFICQKCTPYVHPFFWGGLSVIGNDDIALLT
ncbi:MAG: CHAT domain-containing protein [Caldilineaceae bacterium]|nr:CHAT domain-containing protein [Caldilineaceae bacterium]